MSDPCKIATSYAERLLSCKSNDDLALICAEVSIDLTDEPGLTGWREWLLDITDTAWRNINDKGVLDEVQSDKE